MTNGRAVGGPCVRSNGRKLLVFSSGSRGDVQPIAALGLALQRAGFVVSLSTNVNHVQFLRELGLDAHGTIIDSEHIVHEDAQLAAAMAQGKALKYLSSMSALTMAHFPSALEAKIKLVDTFKPDMILCCGLDYYEGLAIAGARAIPLVPVRLQLTVPSRCLQTIFGEPNCFPHWILGTVFVQLVWLGQYFNKTPVILKQLPEAESFLTVTLQQWMCCLLHPITPALFGFSPTLQPTPSDWSMDLKARSTITGFWVLSKDQQEARFESGDPMFGGDMRAELVAFLGAGRPPVYIGWGSMLCVSAEHMACLAIRTLMRTGQRGIVLGGLAALDAGKLAGQPDSDALVAYARERALFVQTVPHEWLFPRCAAIVHHGGSGTTAAALRSGVPSVVMPCFMDQFMHAGMVVRSGAGIGTKQFSKVTVEGLSAAVERCIGDQAMIRRARSLGERLQAEDGLRDTVTVIDNFFVDEVDSGVWQENFEARNHMLRSMKARRPPGCLAWIGHLFCSSKPNEYKLAAPS